jgi:hypothetical protein
MLIMGSEAVMTPLESAVFDLVRSMAGDATPVAVLLAELRIQPDFADATEQQVAEACSSLSGQSKIWYAADGAKLRHYEPKPEPQRRLFQ